ncbi:orotidine 5'-phosphate decarboxylase [Candidatus Woesearchaeota archaeon]|nr:orotidine 5'-phosphate decarboxylase [Candidatus Woesearchaeota archaeon]
MSIVKLNKSVIPACDVSDLMKLRELIEATCDIKGIGGYKVGFQIVLPHGIRKIVSVIREYTELPIIYDHQKAGTDIPDMAEKFMDVCSEVNAVILFPQSGPVTEEKWIKAAQKVGVGVIVGGEMTHPGYLSSDKGFINDNAPKRIYEIAAKLGVKDFVVPGNKPKKINEYKKFLESLGIKPIFYSPGLIAQGGSITLGAKAAGDSWHAIVGRGIYRQENMRKAAEELVKEIV